MMDNYSLSDIRAATGADNGMGAFGGDGLIWLVVLFLFGFGGFGGNGFGNRDGFGPGATAAAQNEILLGQKFNGVENKLNQIGDGICNSTYALNNSITGEGRALQNQLAQCCCDTRLGIATLGANIDQQTCAITTAVHAEGEATRAMLRENEIQALRDKVSDLQLRSSQCDQNAYLINALKAPCPIPAYTVPNPNCCYGGCGCNGYQPNI